MGDTETPEQRIPATGYPRDWEACMTMNGSWGYHAGDDNWKSVETLIQDLVDIASKGGNFLLNIGPKADGTVPGQSVYRLALIGDWMRVYGESVYATTASPSALTPDWGRSTKETGRLYAHVFTWPADGKLRVRRLQNPIRRIYLVDTPDVSLNYAFENDEIVIDVPSQPPNPYNSVVALDLEGAPAPAPASPS